MQIEIELKDGSRVVYTKAARAYFSRNVLIIVNEDERKIVAWDNVDARIVGVFK